MDPRWGDPGLPVWRAVARSSTSDGGWCDRLLALPRLRAVPPNDTRLARPTRRGHRRPVAAAQPPPPGVGPHPLGPLNADLGSVIWLSAPDHLPKGAIGTSDQDGHPCDRYVTTRRWAPAAPSLRGSTSSRSSTAHRTALPSPTSKPPLSFAMWQQLNWPNARRRTAVSRCWWRYAMRSPTAGFLAVPSR